MTSRAPETLTASTLPEGIPSPDDVADAVEEEARDTATTAMAGAIDDGKARYLELYADVLWLPIAAVVAIAACSVSTVLAPRSMALSLLLGVRRIAGVDRGPGRACPRGGAVGGVHRRRRPEPVHRACGWAFAGLVGRARRLRHRPAPLTPRRPILFAGRSTDQDQTGEVVDMDGTWKITTEQFCSFMATARTPCA